LHGNDRVGLTPRNARLRSFRVTPAGPGNVLPPLSHVTATRERPGIDENHCTWLQQVERQARVGEGVHSTLRSGDVARGLHEFCKLGIRYFGAVHPEACDGYCASGLFFRIDRVRVS
jgi:hypothetical protein